MSATTVLVPVSEDEARRLLSGEIVDLLPRTMTLRQRVARIDAIREDLHSALYDQWEAAQAAAAPKTSWLARFTRRPVITDARLPAGYDPYVHLFGRSFPVSGDSPGAVAERLAKVLALADEPFAAALQEDLQRLGAGAFLASSDVGRGLVPRRDGTDASAQDDIDGSLRTQVDSIRHPKDLRAAWSALLRLSAWSRPVWRLDGELLGQLLTLLAVGTKPEPATELFRSAGIDTGPKALPERIESFSGGGGYFTATAVKALAAALRFQSRLVQTIQKSSEDPDQALRNLRLLSEATFFCEREGLGLAEAAGVEWHDRPR